MKQLFIPSLLLCAVIGGFMVACGSGSHLVQNVAPANPNVLVEQQGLYQSQPIEQVVDVRAGDRIRATLISTQFDPTLMINAGSLLINEDFNGDRTRSELEFMVAQNGSIKVTVTSSMPNAVGAFQLHIERVVGAQQIAAQPYGPSAYASPQYAPQPQYGQAPQQIVAVQRHHQVAPQSIQGAQGTQAAVPARPVRIGERVRENLGGQDARLTSGEFYDTYQLEITQPTNVTVHLESTQVDPYLIVQGSGDQRWVNDDAGGSSNAMLELQLTPGTYRVSATTYRPAEAGNYELVVSARDIGAVSTPTAQPATGPQIINGALLQGDTTLSSGEFVDNHMVTLAAGETVTIRLEATEFDPYVLVRGPSNFSQDNDDLAQGSTTAGVNFVAPAAGEYRVAATSYRAGESGNYVLQITRGGSAAQGSTASTATPASTTAPIRGNLRQGDTTLQGGEFVDSHQVSFAPGQRIRVKLNSNDFDTFLIVRTPSGRTEQNDDAAPNDSHNSLVEIPSAEAGAYTIAVTSYRAGQVGNYGLTFENVAGGGGTNNTGSVWVVSAGISDYPGEGSDLPACANDAIRIVEAMKNQNLVDDAHVTLLTDGQVTKDAVAGALRRVAASAGPEDQFLFFYSGHGGQAPGSDQRELDGKDEFLYLVDGPLLDNDMATLLSGIRARTSIIAFDACFSGGFAKDIINRQGIVGLFSSEEDVPSQVAQQFQAGGYLSHFLRMGLLGEADQNPRDRVLTVGELAHYTWQQYGSHAQDVRMSEGYQHLVMDRGAVSSNQVLWSIAQSGNTP